MLFVDWYYPGYRAGGPTRSCLNMIAFLQEYFDFYVVTRDTDYTTQHSYEGIKSDAWNNGPNGEKVFYCSSANLTRTFIRDIIRSTDHDVIYINGIYSRFFSIYPLFYCRGNKNARVIVATRGMLAKSAIKLKQSRKKLFLLIAKFAGLYRNVVFHATSGLEADDIARELSRDEHLVIAENFPAKAQNREEKISLKKAGSLHLSCIARIAPEKNQEFALNCLRGITDGKVELHFYGPVYDTQYLHKCEKAVKSIGENISVFFHGGLVPEKVQEVLLKSDFLFLPTRGENFGHIILESLICGTPVIISDQTPWNDVQPKGAGFVLPLSEEQFRSKIQRLIVLSPEDHQKLIEKALQYAAEKTNTSPLIERYLHLFN